MKRSTLFFAVAFLLTLAACTPKVTDATKETIKTETEEMIGMTTPDVKYDYETVPGDPLGVKIYTLKNGMKLYMSVNKKEPRIQTNIAVRAGSKHDPADATGLAHYLEHMMFKGTSNIASLDWEKESVLLDEISNLYEKHRSETDPEKRKEIYAEIDRVSGEAATYVAANEYDKMVSSLGAKGTNAYTWVEQTVYVNDIPSNELDRWMKLESERFEECVLRLFHTELEAVYEEFNINQDRDFRKSNGKLREVLFPSHPYGTQSTIGKGEHLKNPSHVKIQEYFDKYYVPNNMAIVVAGDFDPDEMVAMTEKYFGDYKAQDMDRPKFENQPELTERVKHTVYGTQEPYIDMAWKLNGAGSDDPFMIQLITQILYNRKAGLLDLNINKKQKMLESDAWGWYYEDYSVFGMFGKPRQGQSMEEVEKLLLAELDKLKKGEFEEWLMEAAIKNLKLNEIRGNESNGARVGAMTNSFILGTNWGDYVDRFEKMSSISKEDVVAFANKHLRRDNFVVVYKESGEDKEVMKVDKPSITPVKLNRENGSDFANKFLAEETPSLTPQFVDYGKEISRTKLPNGVGLDYLKNEANEIFSLIYVLEMGKRHDKKLPMAVNYLPYMGTDKYSAEELQEEFFKLGLSFSVNAGTDRSYVVLTGLEESLEQGIKLFEDLLANAKGSQETLDNVVADMMVRRENAKKDKNVIRRSAMGSFARYGADNPYTDQLSEAELKALKPAELEVKIRSLTSYEHDVFYYGTKSKAEISKILMENHKVPGALRPIPAGKEYAEKGGVGKKVYFVEFPMVQAEVLMMSKGSENFSEDEYVMAELYNNYFGFGLSSIMFQEIRESRALAYSTYAYYGSPSKKDKAHFMQAYVGTQANKLKDAVGAVREIVNDMPVAEEQIDNARNSLLKQIESERVNGSSKYWAMKSAMERGYDKDMRQMVYEKMKTVTPAELLAFQDKHVKGRDFVILVLGEEKNIGKDNMEYLKSLGEIEYLTLEQLFGY